eukprot:TRINITY_DN3631_c0_g1_i2.p1 TRINITY_DN3631_c0_g1~~TRINITY_DN3631_c0_g1_i2.p1  ORF type:complete len:158 (-),score=15.98 TRINITY_DN3631_c0_g1_i2:64-537(-)
MPSVSMMNPRWWYRRATIAVFEFGTAGRRVLTPYRVTSDHLGQPVTCVSLSNDGNCILAGCLDSTLRLIDRASGDVLNEYRGHTNKSYKLGSCFSNDDAVVLSGSEDGQVFCWDLVEEATRTAFQAHAGTVTGLAFHTAQPCLLTCSVDGTAKVWNT